MSDELKNTIISVADKLTKRIKSSVSPFHTVAYTAEELKDAGYEEIKLTEKWNLQRGKNYFAKVYGSTLIAFSIGKNWDGKNIRLAAAHTDFPCLKIKPSCQIKENNYVKCNVEVYGGAILNTWLDRPLSAAGRIVLKSNDVFEPKIELIDLKRPLFIIPNLAIHMNRNVNKGVELNPQKDMLPITDTVQTAEEAVKENIEKTVNDNRLFHAIAQEAGVEENDILECDLFIYPVEEPLFIGVNDDLFTAGRLDNLTSVQACISGIKESSRDNGINVAVIYDSEEVGSGTKQGAGSIMTRSVLKRIYDNFQYDNEDFECALSSAVGLSVDVAHAIHPNSPEKSDITNKLYMNKGFAVKTAASERYASDLKVLGILMQICEKENIAYQRFVNRSDMPGGSTLGAIAVGNMPIHMLDVGVPILAMHSARETMGIYDQYYLNQFLKCFYDL